jgi:hypothetical protein
MLAPYKTVIGLRFFFFSLFINKCIHGFYKPAFPNANTLLTTQMVLWATKKAALSKQGCHLIKNGLY